MSWMNFFGGGSRGNSREQTKDAIVKLRQHVMLMEKREEFLQKKIDEELKKARANATTNKRRA